MSLPNDAYYEVKSIAEEAVREALHRIAGLESRVEALEGWLGEAQQRIADLEEGDD